MKEGQRENSDFAFLDVRFGGGSLTHEFQIGRLFFDPIGKGAKTPIELRVSRAEMFQRLNKQRQKGED
jgi:hypothetical protein